MSAEASLDADAFMRKYLKQPADATARLVFADWLEETGEPHNAAWAHFIRLRVEADRFPLNSGARHEIDRHAGQYAVHIRAKLTIPAKLFVGYPKSLLQLLPEPNLTVRLAEFSPPQSVREHLPESVARENFLFPLAVQDGVILIAAECPANADTLQTLEFILNRTIVLVGADRADVQEAIEREYGPEPEFVDTLLIEFVDTAITFTRTTDDLAPDPSDAPVVRLVNILLSEAIDRRADRVTLTPTPDALTVRYRVAGEWVERDAVPRRLARATATRLAITAGIDIGRVFADPPPAVPLAGAIKLATPSGRFRIGVQISSTPDGPATQLDIVAEPPEPPSPVPCP